MKKIIALVALLMFSHVGYSQLSFGRRAEYSQSANANDKQLFLIDFWATYCAPCITVAKYLNVLQEQFPEELYIVSLAYQSEDEIFKFLDVHPTKLAVSIDDNRKNFNEFQIRAMPEGILFNAKGEVVWRGNPANLKDHMVEKFLRKHKSKIAINDFIKYNNPSPNKKSDDDYYIPIKYNITDYSISSSDEPYEEGSISIRKNEDFTVINGNLEQVVGYLLGANQKQIKSDVFVNKTYNIILQDKQKKATKQEIAQELLAKEGLKYTTDSEIGEIYRFTLDNGDKNFWDKNSLDWGTEERPAFIISDSDLKADNITYETFVYRLSNLIDQPIVLDNKDNLPDNVYDWEVHYEFKDLMHGNLERLGIQPRKQKGSYPVYTIQDN